MGQAKKYNQEFQTMSKFKKKNIFIQGNEKVPKNEIICNAQTDAHFVSTKWQGKQRRIK